MSYEERLAMSKTLLEANKPKAEETIEPFILPESTFIECEWSMGDFSEDTPEAIIESVNELRKLYPEICNWGQCALWEAWSWYSQDCWLVSVMEITKRDTWFLGYIYQVQIKTIGINNWNGDTKTAEQGVDILKKIEADFNKI